MLDLSSRGNVIGLVRDTGWITQSNVVCKKIKKRIDDFGSEMV